jgi:hypothetical protein
LKFRSCATLFAQVSDQESPFHRILSVYYRGGPDVRTLDLVTMGKVVEGGQQSRTVESRSRQA